MAWSAPVRVAQSDTEPSLAADASGNVYDAPTSEIFASRNGGATWTAVSPAGALPTLGSDASVSVAPDGTIWYARLWGYPDGTLACSSADHAASWTCNNLAIPGVTDRMWIVGVSAKVAYLGTNLGMQQTVWTKTTDGGATFQPFAVNAFQIEGTQTGNMVYDETRQAVFQVAVASTGLVLVKLTDSAVTPVTCATPLQRGLALPTLAVSGGTLWLAEETGDGILVARSDDGCETWTTQHLPSAAKRVVFAAVAVRGSDAAVSYYGSDDPADAGSNGGSWSLYVARTHDTGSAQPTWTEARVASHVHKGSVCVAISCDPSGTTGARFAGDFMTLVFDARGRLVVGYNDDSAGPGQDWTCVVTGTPAV